MANSLLKALGLSEHDRAVLIHTDDIGMCHASLAAYADLAAVGIISSGSVMVPCPWFQATAHFCREHPAIVDMGVHITLTSEWHSGYRWGPVSTRDPASGLLDDAGYLPTTSEAVQRHASPEAVRAEVFAQVERALAAGIDVTHIDSHMGTVFFPGFLESYLEVARRYSIPPFLVRRTQAQLEAMGFPQPLAARLPAMIQELERQDLPLFDEIATIPFAGRARHLAQARRTLEQLPAGLTYLIIHPSKDTPELRAIMPDVWEARVADYEIFTQDAMRTLLHELGIHVIRWRQLRDLFRSR